MFDDLINNQTGQADDKAGRTAQKPTEDIFAEAMAKEDSSPPKPQVFQPVNPNPNFSSLERPANPSSKGVKKALVAVIIILALILIFLGIWHTVYTILPRMQENKTPDSQISTTTQPIATNPDEQQPSQPEQPQEQPVPTDAPASQETIAQEAAAEPEATTTATTTSTASEERPIETPSDETPSSTQDSDSDGLTDEEEKLVGTDPNEVDSDQDGLFDRDEIKVYQTNPLLADTDKDGYNDGSEVKNGYNPAGPGKLYELNP